MNVNLTFTTANSEFVVSSITTQPQFIHYTYWVPDPNVTGLPVLTYLCGDGFIDGPEECEDGNILDNDGCSSLCMNEYCGDGII